MLISCSNIAKIYSSDSIETSALKGVSFAIEKGEFVAIIGPSGSGKSTLLHILGFLDRQTSGEYRFAGRSVNAYSEEEAARLRNESIGFVFQAFNLLPKTNVLNNVMLPLLYSRVPKQEWEPRARAAIEEVGLSHRASHEPSQLSGGEKQRVAIARALVNNPEIIFADEPTGNLDTKSGEIIMDVLSQLNKEHGHTIILITHERDIASYARRVITMRDGKIENDQ